MTKELRKGRGPDPEGPQARPGNRHEGDFRRARSAPSIILRYPRLFLAFARFSISRALEFRLDFCFRIVMDLMFYAMSLAFYRVLYLHAPSFGGWTEPEALVFVSGFLVVDAIQMTLFANNVWWLPELVNQGHLDYHLVRPVSTLFMVTFRDFAANSFVNLVMAAGILAWALTRLPEPLSAGAIALYALLLLNGAFIHYFLHLLFLLPVFVSQGGRGLEPVFWTCVRFAERPDAVFDGWLRRALVTALPFGLMASVPARFALGFGADGGPDWGLLALVAGVTLALFGAVLLGWRLALRAYGSASS